MIEKLKAHEWKQTNFYTINEEALKATFRTLNNGANTISKKLSYSLSPQPPFERGA
jgi:hypothetical protein